MALFRPALDRRVRSLGILAEPAVNAVGYAILPLINADHAQEVFDLTGRMLAEVDVSHGGEHLDRSRVELFHGMAAIGLRRFRFAAAHLRRALIAGIERDGVASVAAASARVQLARALTGLRQYEEAGSLLREAEKTLRTEGPRFLHAICKKAITTLKNSSGRPE